MALAITEKKLADWAGSEVLADAKSLASRGAVIKAEYDPPNIIGTVMVNSRPINTRLEITKDGHVENHCPCWINQERGLICPHAIAVALVVVLRNTDPERERKYLEEKRRASRLEEYEENDYIARVVRGTPNAVPAFLHIVLDRDWQEQFKKGNIFVECVAEVGSKRMALEKMPRKTPFCFEKNDESLLYVIEDICGGPAQSSLSVKPSDFINIIDLLVGSKIEVRGGNPITVNVARMKTVIRMDLDRENGEILLNAHTELPFMKEGMFLFYAVSGKRGYVLGAENIWPLESVLPLPLHQLYLDTVTVPRNDVVRLISFELPTLLNFTSLDSEITPDLFSLEPASPVFHLSIRGSPASISFTLLAAYNDIRIPACKPDSREHFGIPDPDDLMRYLVRNKQAEQEALEMLAQAGIQGERGDELNAVVDNHHVLNFLGRVMPSLRRAGWKIEIEGKVAPYADTLDFVTPVVNISEPSGAGWFEVGFDFDDGHGQHLSPTEIQQALQRGDSYIKRGSRTILIDSEAVESMRDVFSDCLSTEGASPGQFRMSSIYAPFVKSALDALDGVDIEAAKEWRVRASESIELSRIEPAPIDNRIAPILRPYQTKGVDWLYWHEANKFCGILADEMGLGKTIQTLAWLSLPRRDSNSQAKPALIVCPTSLVENWIEEAEKFTPWLKTIAMTGSDRHDRWDDAQNKDLIVTSYALLRRDSDRYQNIDFAAAILDEAQHIKNRNTQNSLAAKSIKADYRLVLTGTPMENSVADLWSIMDYLMPGYLGSASTFRQSYEHPIAKGGQAREYAQARLRKKLHPFLLRRLKKEVARDLPPKIQRVATCDLTPDQKLVYTEVLNQARNKISGLISKNGFNKARMEILAVLTRLRQISCHLGLLNIPDLKSDNPSSKMDLFFELVDQALDSGHRILVFSQFVSMLKILSGELDKKKLTYCYLDGATKNRLEIVHKFNKNREIPLFLISLKAGGTGLNLTGADMVIHFDPWWNPAVEDQATDRAYRIGQKRTVYSIKLVARGTVEEKVVEMQKSKKSIINATVETDEDMVQSISQDDLTNLLDLS